MGAAWSCWEVAQSVAGRNAAAGIAWSNVRLFTAGILAEVGAMKGAAESIEVGARYGDFSPVDYLVTITLMRFDSNDPRSRDQNGASGIFITSLASCSDK